MKTLDKYILFRFLKTYAFVVGLLTLIIVIMDFTDKNDDFIKYKIPAVEVGKYYLAYAPWIGNLLSPITVFITTVLVTSSMASKTEIVAILSVGMSFRRMLLPFLMGSTLIAILSFYANGWLIPNSNKYRIGFEIEYLKKPFYFSERDVHFKIDQNDYLYIQRYNNQSKSAFLVTIERIVDHQLKTKFYAQKMTWIDSLSTWRFKDWELRKINGLNEQFTKGHELDSAINISAEDFENHYHIHETMNMNDLANYIALLKSRGSGEADFYEIERYVRYMLPFTAIILTFMGVSVAAEKSTRGGTGFKLALGFVIAFAFIILFVLVKAIAEAGSIHPIIAIWIPNTVGTTAAFILYWFVPK